MFQNDVELCLEVATVKFNYSDLQMIVGALEF